MMTSTRRERLERKLELRREWADKRAARATAKIAQAINMTAGIPMGQPTLVGHHSERGHRALLARSDNAMRAGCESAAMAKHHESKADGIESQIETSIFSDDPDALEQLEAKIASMEAQRERHKRVGAAWRKLKKPNSSDLAAWSKIQELAGITAEQAEKYRQDCRMEETFCGRGPVPGYVLLNLGGRITAARNRIVDVKNRQRRSKAADDAGGIAIEGAGEYARVTFAEKPERSILNALRAAGFYWGSGSWTGRRDKLPECVKELATA